MIHVFDFDLLRGATEDSHVLVKQGDKEFFIKSLSTDKDGNVIIEVFDEF